MLGVRFVRRFLLLGVAAAIVGTACAGAGSTFDAPLFQKAFYDYSAKYPAVSVNYQPVGSGAGIQQFIKNTVDFGATDVPMAAADITSAGGPDTLTQIPVTLGVVSIAF